MRSFVKLMLILLLCTGCTEAFKRRAKNLKSNYLGGLDRVCKVYSDGTKIAEYKGSFDLKFGNDKLHFDNDGKRTIIVGGTVVCDEI